MTPNARTKMFNASFKIWKRRDLSPVLQNVKVGQIFDAYVTHLSESSVFYLRHVSLVPKIAELETCLQNYANELLRDVSLRSELLCFQTHTTKFDMVVVKTEKNGWRRAVLNEQVSNSSFDVYSDGEDDSPFVNKSSSRAAEPKSFYTFYLVDWGNEITLVKKQTELNSEIFMLPMNEKLIQIGPLTVKSGINQSLVNLTQTMSCDSELNRQVQRRRDLFEKRFKELVVSKKLRVRVSQKVFLNSELEIIVEPFFAIDEAEALIETFKRTFHSEFNLDDGGLVPLDKKSMNVVLFVRNEIVLIERREVSVGFLFIAYLNLLLIHFFLNSPLP
jgi:hypothetical protein